MFIIEIWESAIGGELHLSTGAMPRMSTPKMSVTTSFKVFKREEAASAGAVCQLEAPWRMGATKKEEAIEKNRRRDDGEYSIGDYLESIKYLTRL